MVRVVRFELTNGRVRAYCLTAWRHPNMKFYKLLNYNSIKVKKNLYLNDKFYKKVGILIAGRESNFL